MFYNEVDQLSFLHLLLRLNVPRFKIACKMGTMVLCSAL